MTPTYDADELETLLDALEDGDITPLQHARLAEILRTHESSRRHYARYMLLCGDLPEAGETSTIRPDFNLDTIAQISGLRAAGSSPVEEPAEMTVPKVLNSPTPGRRSSAAGILLAIGAVAITSLAACLAVMIYIHYWGQSPHAQEIAITRPAPSVEPLQVASVSAVAGAVWEPLDGLGAGRGESIAPGFQSPHRLLRLHSGGAEILFDSGARVVLEGPADFRVDGPNRGTLAFGKLVAHVPPPARGFAIATPRALVTDHGTVFGVNVSDTGAALVHMYEGSADVAVTGADAPPPADSSLQSPVPVRAHDVISQTSAGALAWVEHSDPRAFDEEFVIELRDLRRPLAMHSTGVGLRVGDHDPYWQIISTPPGAKFKPGNAIVTWPTGPISWGTANNAPQVSKWISLDGHIPSGPAGNYVFRTTVDLTGFDSSAVQIRGDVSVDDAVKDILINGKSTGVQVPYIRGGERSYRIIIDKGFAPGINQVDFVVWNRPLDHPQEKINLIGLRVEWEGEALPTVER